MQVSNSWPRALLTICLALLGALSCHRQPATEPVPFPDSNEVAGWVKVGSVRTFEAADLWKYIDGDAERYLKSGVQRVFTADYKFQNTLDAVVDVYVMQSPEGATKIFQSEPVGDAKPAQLGDSARIYSQNLVFRKGFYLVRIVAYQESVEFPRALLVLGQAVERRLAK